MKWEEPAWTPDEAWRDGEKIRSSELFFKLDQPLTPEQAKQLTECMVILTEVLNGFLDKAVSWNAIGISLQWVYTPEGEMSILGQAYR